jgi:hypothetical protein
MGRVANASVATGATLNQDLDTGAEEWLTVIAVVGTAANAAGAAGDVSVNVLPYLDDSVSGLQGAAKTLAPLNLPTADSIAAVLSSSRAYVLARYRISGISKVQIQAKNNNAGSKPVEINYTTG